MRDILAEEKITAKGSAFTVEDIEKKIKQTRSGIADINKKIKSGDKFTGRLTRYKIFLTGLGLSLTLAAIAVAIPIYSILGLAGATAPYAADTVNDINKGIQASKVKKLEGKVESLESFLKNEANADNFSDKTLVLSDISGESSKFSKRLFNSSKDEQENKKSLDLEI